MTIPSVLIKDTLVADGLKFATSDDWSIWIGKEPKEPSRSITIYDVAGSAPNPKWLLDYPSIQIRVSGGPNDYKEVAEKAAELLNRLNGRPSYNAYDGGGDRVVMINALGGISFIGWNENNEPSFIINFDLIIEPSPTTSPTNREPL